jgi:hypothetical protein
MQASKQTNSIKQISKRTNKGNEQTSNTQTSKPTNTQAIIQVNTHKETNKQTNKTRKQASN